MLVSSLSPPSLAPEPKNSSYSGDTRSRDLMSGTKGGLEGEKENSPQAASSVNSGEHPHQGMMKAAQEDWTDA